VQNAEDIKVILNDKREFKGRVIGTDPKTDVAVIKIEANGLPAIKMGDSGKARAGDVVLAIGNPFGLNQTITQGIVSATGRANVGISEYEDFIQTDAAINPGNSGGALVNTNGELIGINTAIFSTSGGYMGIGFAIPSNMANAVAQSILKYGRVIRGWLGITIQDITPELAKAFDVKVDKGALVTDVTQGSPAEKAGFQRGDLIVEFNGKQVENSAKLKNEAANTKPGTTVPVKVIRSGAARTINVTVGEFPEKKPAVKKAEPKKSEFNNALNGVFVQDITPEARESLNLPEKIKGVIVVNVGDESPARDVLAKNDIIQEINRKPVNGLKGYEDIVSKIGPSESVLLLIYRNGSHLYATIKQ
ncbi:MAG TPA: Do family serine endopeptidase, partial [Dissulfurispiraceae bacterium]